MNEIKFIPIGTMKMGNKQKAKKFKELAIFSRKCFLIGVPAAYAFGLLCGLLL